jgi:hypothetical protein
MNQSHQHIRSYCYSKVDILTKENLNVLFECPYLTKNDALVLYVDTIVVANTNVNIVTKCSLSFIARNRSYVASKLPHLVVKNGSRFIVREGNAIGLELSFICISCSITNNT